MKCSFCGHELEPGSNFCPECGTMMSVDEESPVVSEVSDEQKYEPDSAEAYSNEVDRSGEPIDEPADDEIGVPEYVPHTEDAFEDYNTIRRNEEEAEAAKEAEKTTPEEEDDPFAELHPDSEPVSLHNEKKEQPEEATSFDDDDDMYIKSSKSKKGGVTFAVLAVVLVAVIVGGVYAVKKNGGDILSVFKKPSVSATTEGTTETEKKSTQESVTEKKTTEEKSSDKTTEEEDTTEPTTKKDEKTTEKESTQESTATASTESTTKTPASSESISTRPYTTTTKPQTTAPTTYTTRPSTTRPVQTTTKAPSTTTEVLKKPTKYYSSAVTRYATENGISIRLRPSLSSSVRASISIGGEVKVYAEENGFCYVYYARYGVYGWVNAKYLSKERPVAEKEVNVSGVVKPDKTYSNPVTKTVSTSDGLRLRKGPGTNYDTIRYLGKGYPVAVKGTSSKNPGWVYVTDITRGVSGWVSAAYIK